MRRTKRELGQLGEELAVRYLRGQGYLIRERNWRCPLGEMDIVAEDGDCLAFVEVRTRRGRELGTPEESITQVKRSRLIEVAQTYLQEHDWPGDWRIDVLAVEMSPQGDLRRVNLIKNAVVG